MVSQSPLLKDINNWHVKFADYLGLSHAVLRNIISVVISSIFLNTVFLPLLSLALFVAYMHQYKFFSYDFFIDGIFGMKLFVLAMIFGLLVSSIGIFGIFISGYAKIVKGWNVPKTLLFVTGAISTLLISLLGYGFFSGNDNWDFSVFALAINSYLALYMAIVLFSQVKARMVALVGLFLMTFYVIVSQPKYSIMLLENGLRAFGVGGEIPVAIDSKDGSHTSGKLILLTPKYIYYKSDDSDELSFQLLDNVHLVKLLKVSKPS